MSNVNVSAAPARRTFFRFWFPWLALSLGVLVVAGVWIWFWLDPDYPPSSRNSTTLFTGVFTLLALLLWSLVVSRRRLLILLGALLVVAAGPLALRSLHFDGDMVPVVEFRWSPTRDEILEAHRNRQAQEAPAAELAFVPERRTDFPEYRGRQRDGIVTGPLLARDWKAKPPRLLWRQPVGGGYAAFAVAGNAAVTIEQRRDREAVVCYDIATGRERWRHEYAARFTEALGGEGLRATPTIAGGDVYALGAQGMLSRLNLETGERKWSINILQDSANLPWGMSGSPLVFDQLVVVNPGAATAAASGRALVAFDRATGNPVWASGTTPAGYSSPMLANLAGRRQILLLDGQSLGGYDPDRGTQLWSYPWEIMNGINVAQPVVLDGGRIFISSAYGVGCAMLRVAEADGKWSIETLWKNKAMRCKFTSPVAYQGFLYGLDEGILTCLDEQTGARQWRDGRYGHGQLLLTGDLLLILSERGKLALVRATPEGQRELSQFQALKGQKTWNNPALADGKAYLRNNEEMACYDLTASEAK